MFPQKVTHNLREIIAAKNTHSVLSRFVIESSTPLATPIVIYTKISSRHHRHAHHADSITETSPIDES